ncbi:hypothetical protein [Rhizobium sp. CF142]|nr:hypothetical protein [Rhizobium sp. CF142]
MATAYRVEAETSGTSGVFRLPAITWLIDKGKSGFEFELVNRLPLR